MSRGWRPFLKPGIAALGALAAALAFPPPGWAADVRNGERLYTMHCGGCHGPNGVPQMPGAPDFKRGRALLRPDAELLRGIRRGRGAMPGYFGILTDREILDVVAFTRTLG
jgi:cytochrome c6